jgi:hypothetical protein
VLDEQFADNGRGWPNDPDSTAWLGGTGGYRLFARRPGQFVAVGAPAPQTAGTLRDVVIEATFRKLDGPSGGGYGVIVRDQGPGPRDGLSQDGRYYVLEVGDRGEFGVWRRERDRWIDLVPWTPHPAIRPGGAANDLVVQATGAELTLLVNGTQVARVVDTALATGGVGVFAGGDLNEVALERYVLRVPA